MLALKYSFMILGFVLFGSAASLVGYDIFLSEQLRRLLRRTAPNRTGPRAIAIAHPGQPAQARVLAFRLH
jgi:hypothetical protein